LKLRVKLVIMHAPGIFFSWTFIRHLSLVSMPLRRSPCKILMHVTTYT
jgi:hypothetical protein